MFNYSFVYSHFRVYCVGNTKTKNSEAVYKHDLLLEDVLNFKYVN